MLFFLGFLGWLLTQNSTGNSTLTLWGEGWPPALLLWRVFVSFWTRMVSSRHIVGIFQSHLIYKEWIHNMSAIETTFGSRASKSVRLKGIEKGLVRIASRIYNKIWASPWLASVPALYSWVTGFKSRYKLKVLHNSFLNNAGNLHQPPNV